MGMDPVEGGGVLAIPASLSVTLEPGIRGGPQPIFCSCEALGVGPMTKTDCFNYIRANQPDEFYTVPVPHGDPRRTALHGGGNYRVTIPSSWTVTMASIATDNQDWFLCVNETLEPTCSFTNRRACV